MKYKPVEVRAYNSYDVDAASRAADAEGGGVLLTVQADKDETDINEIVKRFGITGELPVTKRVPLNLEFYEHLEYRVALDAVRNAEKAFNDLPAAVRTRFGNDPGNFVDFASDPANLGEMKAMGLGAPVGAVEPGSGVAEPVEPPKAAGGS